MRIVIESPIGTTPLLGPLDPLIQATGADLNCHVCQVAVVISMTESADDPEYTTIQIAGEHAEGCSHWAAIQRQRKASLN